MNATNIGGASSDWWDISRIYYEYKATFKVDAANAPKPLATAFFDAATASGGLGAGYAKMTPIIEGRLTSAEGDKVIKLLDAATTHFGRALTTIDSICASAGVTT
ncbi:MAG: hypothetical protein ABI912_08610 [Actinomycetota bacterium]